jgi:hypothetical protein
MADWQRDCGLEAVDRCSTECCIPKVREVIFVAALVGNLQVVLQREGVLARTGFVGSSLLNRRIGVARLARGLRFRSRRSMQHRVLHTQGPRSHFCRGFG